MVEYYKKAVFENYANFSGRARRSEYWYFILMNILIIVGMVLPSMALFSGMIGPVFIIVLVGYVLAMIIPTLALIARRLHDIGKSGWYFLVRFIPVVGPIWFLILMCTEGNSGSNQYGIDPKGFYDEINDIGNNSY